MSPPVLSEAQKPCVDVVVNTIETQTHKTHKDRQVANMSNIQKIPKYKNTSHKTQKSKRKIKTKQSTKQNLWEHSKESKKTWGATQRHREQNRWPDKDRRKHKDVNTREREEKKWRQHDGKQETPQLKTKTITVDRVVYIYVSLHSVYVCFPTGSPERDLKSAESWSQTAEATPPLLLHGAMFIQNVLILNMPSVQITPNSTLHFCRSSETNLPSVKSIEWTVLQICE